MGNKGDWSMFSNYAQTWLTILQTLHWHAVIPTLVAAVWTFIFVRTIPDLVRTPRLRQVRRAEDERCAAKRDLGKVSVIVAARDEAERIRQTVESLTAQTYPNMEIILVDDRSSDDTGAEIDRQAALVDNIVPIHITELPRGWLGKNHALYVGSKQATGDWLLFADADVYFYPDAIERAMQYVHTHKLQHLTVAPRLIATGYWLRMLTAMYIFNYVLFKRPQSAYRRRARAHAGIGAFNLVARQAYEKSGTHKAISLRPDDDLLLGKQIKRHGFRQRFVLAQQCIEIEWYPDLSSMIVGMEKAPLPAFRYSALLLFLSMVLMMALYSTPFIGAFVGPGWYRLLYGYALLLMCILYELHAVFLKLPKHQFLILPIGMLLYSYAFIRSAVLAVRRGGLVWRDTFYTLRELRRGL
ncbi:glycosyl transferase family 2 [Alicyclobacillus hesperidum]|uniref:Glycosyl transferase family 2 n=2 Tax=Alicyclobacillus hesperidum TaxID=89784 RepID=A0A1H2R138_9BACL|nr:glycosyl transferase family 2 [Alicyclobacillus hesperidum]SDW13065.1 Glycosyltransferase, catalytic subunit of cellulose synthase and poly-beta-1,6-N-acetylglucosamine synthase [Alicyclobacillus hesperidum]